MTGLLMSVSIFGYSRELTHIKNPPTIKKRHSQFYAVEHKDLKKSALMKHAKLKDRYLMSYIPTVVKSFKLLNAVFCVGLLLFISSCANHDDYGMMPERSYRIDIDRPGTFNIDDYAKFSRLIRLETTAESLIGEISKIQIMWNEDILILDKLSENLFMFDSAGNFIKTIGRKGNGPNEYAEISDFEFDEEQGNIYIYDRLKHRFLLYNSAGEFIKELQTDLTGNAFTKIGDKFWFYYPYSKDSRFYLILTDDKLKNVEKAYFQWNRLLPSSYSPCFSGTGAEKYFFFIGSNIIYRLDGKKLLPENGIDFGKYTFPYDKIPDLDNKAFEELVSGNDYVGDLSGVVISNDFCFLKFREIKPAGVSSRSYFAVIDFGSGAARTYDSAKSSDMLVDFFSPLLVTKDKEIAYPIYPSHHNSIYYETLRKYFPSLTQDSNPLLAFYSLN